MEKLTPEQYDELKRFLDFFTTRHFPLEVSPPERRPMAVLEAMEKTAPKRAMQGLMMAVNDCIDDASTWKIEKARAFDAELKAAGIVTLSELRQRYSRDYARIVKRGHIKTPIEYYLLKGVLDDGALELAPDEQQLVAEMLVTYEEKIMREQ